MLRNAHLIEYTKELTIAKLSNTTTPINSEGAKDVADFMQAIYDKLVELNEKSND